MSKPILTIEKAKAAANKFGGILLSETVLNSKNKLEWKCIEGHIFTKSFDNVNRLDMWCNLCSLKWRSEEICRVYFETIFGKKFPKYRQNWLVNCLGVSLELDGYCEELGLAFEHHGEHHYTPGWFHAHKVSRQKFDKTISNDIDKKKVCEQKGIELIIIPQLYKHTTTKQLEVELKNLSIKYGNQPSENYFYDFSKLTKSQYCRDRLQLAKDIAEKKWWRVFIK